MKLLAYLIITVSLIVGSITAVTAYVPRVDALEPSQGTLSLNADAGRNPDAPEEPLLSPSQEAPILITDEVAAQLAEAGVERVRVKEFSFGRWEHKWWFLASMVGLLLGAFIIRQEERKHVATLLHGTVDATETPEYALEATHEAVEALLADLRPIADEAAQVREITHRIETLQETHLAAFVAARPTLVGRYGIAGYARIMDAFARAERQLNRAWSAAADEVLPEAHACLHNGLAALEETRHRLATHEGDGATA